MDEERTYLDDTWEPRGRHQERRPRDWEQVDYYTNDAEEGWPYPDYDDGAGSNPSGKDFWRPEPEVY